MPLVGFRYIQNAASTPTGFAGYQWFNPDTSKLYEWTGTNLSPNTGSGTWNEIYDGNQPKGGLLPVTGGAVTGAITGPTGWAAKDNYNFPTLVKMGGQTVATVSYVNQQVSSFNDLISAKISQSIASSTASINTNSNIAKANGYYGGKGTPGQGTQPEPLQAIQLPTYPNSGGLASETECVWIGAPGSLVGVVKTAYSQGPGVNFTAYIQTFFSQTSNRVYEHYAKSTGAGNGAWSPTYTGGGLHWLIFGVKSSS